MESEVSAESLLRSSVMDTSWGSQVMEIGYTLRAARTTCWRPGDIGAECGQDYFVDSGRSGKVQARAEFGKFKVPKKAQFDLVILVELHGFSDGKGSGVSTGAA
ncbi:uncharacterized protein LOC120427038 [Culex pipiens pallens]|uniref:uncharacterized protein LOC120427038 n=1 Tax=Culex pipiens pallens TaxID=42434 RepID=UPI001953A58C|nr:uncharacterized protein LOC120427038 [Culex pipiens pallens]